MKNKHESTTKKQGRKRNCPEVQRVEWSDGTMKEYAKQLKKSFKQIVKDLELEKEIKDLFKRETKSCIRENSFFYWNDKKPNFNKICATSNWSAKQIQSEVRTVGQGKAMVRPGCSCGCVIF